MQSAAIPSCRQLAPDDKEKAGIAALLGNVARLLLVMIDFGRFVEISRRVQAGATETTASFEVLGMSVEALTKEVPRTRCPDWRGPPRMSRRRRSHGRGFRSLDDRRRRAATPGPRLVQGR